MYTLYQKRLRPLAALLGRRVSVSESDPPNPHGSTPRLKTNSQSQGANSANQRARSAVRGQEPVVGGQRLRAPARPGRRKYPAPGSRPPLRCNCTRILGASRTKPAVHLDRKFGTWVRRDGCSKIFAGCRGLPLKRSVAACAAQIRTQLSVLMHLWPSTVCTLPTGAYVPTVAVNSVNSTCVVISMLSQHCSRPTRRGPSDPKLAAGFARVLCLKGLTSTTKRCQNAGTSCAPPHCPRKAD